MKKATLVQSLVGLVVFGLGLTTGLFAQPTSGSPPPLEQKRNELSGAPGMEVISTVVEFKIGETVELHSHHGIETIYVIQGASVQVPGKDPRTLPTGATLVNLRDVKHGGFKVVGDTSLKLFTVHVVDQGKPLYDYSK